jgi:hypothetical protein
MTINTDVFMKRLYRLLAISALAALCSCAGSRAVVHSITINVYGTDAVSDIRVMYGRENIEWPGPTRPGGGGTQGGRMIVPESMAVSWTVSGKPQEVAIPLKSKLSNTDRIGRWHLKFYGERLEVWRADDDPDSKYYRKPEVKVYP